MNRNWNKGKNSNKKGYNKNWTEVQGDLSQKVQKMIDFDGKLPIDQDPNFKKKLLTTSSEMIENLLIQVVKDENFSLVYNLQKNAYEETQLLINPRVNDIFCFVKSGILGKTGKKVLVASFTSKNMLKNMRE